MAESVKQTNEGLATVTQAAEYLAVSRYTIWRLVNAGELETRMVRRMRRITWDSLKRYAGLD